MANNFVHDDGTILATNTTGSDVVSGEVFQAGDTVCVALVDIANTASGRAAVRGTYDLPKAAAAGAIAAGARVNYASGEITDGVGTACGIAAVAAGANDTRIEVYLNVNHG